MNPNVILPPAPNYKSPTKISDNAQRTEKYIQQTGNYNNIQAKYNYLCAKAIHENMNPRLFMLMASPKKMKSEAWEQAYEFVYDFLKKSHLPHTLETVHTEFLETGEPEIQEIFDQYDRNEYFASLLDAAQERIDWTIKDCAKAFNPSIPQNVKNGSPKEFRI